MTNTITLRVDARRATEAVNATVDDLAAGKITAAEAKARAFEALRDLPGRDARAAGGVSVPADGSER